MRKFKDFSATYFLREINFGWFQKVKNCQFNHFGGFEFEYLENFTLSNVKNSQKFKIQSFKKGQNGSFWGFKMTKIDFT